jgi:hypothetical protein
MSSHQPLCDERMIFNYAYIQHFDLQESWGVLQTLLNMIADDDIAVVQLLTSSLTTVCVHQSLICLSLIAMSVVQACSTSARWCTLLLDRSSIALLNSLAKKYAWVVVWI